MLWNINTQITKKSRDIIIISQSTANFRIRRKFIQKSVRALQLHLFVLISF